MRIMSLIETPNSIPLGAFTGSTGMQDVIDHMNSTWRSTGGGVIFGEGVFGDRYRAFRELITTRQQAIVDEISKTVQAVTCPDRFQLIDSQEALENIPACMQIPILSYAPVRKLFEEGQIRGWGIDWKDLPEEDVYGRMIKDGSFDSSDEKWMKDPESGVTYTVKTGDPDLAFEELKLIKDSREFIDSWLEEQLGPNGDRLDLTDLPNQMGKLRKVDDDESDKKD